MQPNFTERSDVKLVQMSEKPNIFFFLFPNESNFGEAQVTIFLINQDQFLQFIILNGKKHRICKQTTINKLFRYNPLSIIVFAFMLQNTFLL